MVPLSLALCVSVCTSNWGFCVAYCPGSDCGNKHRTLCVYTLYCVYTSYTGCIYLILCVYTLYTVCIHLILCVYIIHCVYISYTVCVHLILCVYIIHCVYISYTVCIHEAETNSSRTWFTQKDVLLLTSLQATNCHSVCHSVRMCMYCM